ncbi:PREDICTED: glypican-5-like isoform X2 [Nanorana parkeri]|uniref:glypican-5-like isoform X2 n=1 Tax=Nanorana parkeri TaxID=125878 RepID=UPI00085459FF|nr:PREDICTED: glypican-5-like isoform X2 [Nanorana parkeri]
MSRLLLLLLLLLNFVALMPADGPPSCHEVRAAFQLQQVGRGRLVPEVPVEESDVQICEQKAPTCCTRKMEESYLAAVKRKLSQNIQALNFELKFTIVAHSSAFQETFTYLIDLATNNTFALFHSKYRFMAQDVQDSVKELFTDLSLNIMGADMPLEDAFSRFLDALFPLVYNHLINPRKASLSEEYLDCLRLTRQDINPFGNYSHEMTVQLSKSLWTCRMMKQALNMAEQVINSTEHAGLTRECTHALVKMQYCPHCQGLTLIRPCVGYCLNVMRGCLASLASLDGPWREFINLVEHLADQMTGSHDLEQSLLGIRDVIEQSIQHAESQGSHLSKMVEKVCGELQESPVKEMSEMNTSKEDPAAVLPPAAKLHSLAQMRSDFIKYIKPSRTFYTTLAERLCDGDLAVRDGSTCWNGDDVVESYTNLVVSSDFKDQVNNPEVKVRGSNVIINQVINKLRLFIQMGSERRIKPERWRITEGSGGGGGSQGEDLSGDCDDEDGCQGSGDSMDTDIKRRTDLSMVNLTKIASNPGATKTSPKEKDSSDSGSRVCTSSAIVVASLLIMCQFISQLCNAAATL